MLAEMLIYHFHKLAGINHGGEMLGEWDKRTNRWAVDIEKYDLKIAKMMLNKVQKNRYWGWQVAKKISYFSKRLLKFTKNIFNSDLSRKSNEELYKLYMRYRDEFINMYIYAWFPNSLEGKLNIFTAKLENFLKMKLGRLNNSDQSGEYLSLLTSPAKITNREKEEIEFLKIIGLIQKNEKLINLFRTNSIIYINENLPQMSPAINKLITNHHKKYCWLPFDYEGPAWSREYFLKRAKNLLVSKVNPKKELAKINFEKEKIKKRQKRFALELDLDKNKKFGYIFKLGKKFLNNTIFNS